MCRCAATPPLSHPRLDQLAGRSVVCKVEALQRSGSFKFRSAYNAVAALSPRQRRRGVIGASSGNHAQALALAGQLLGVPVTVVVPHDAPPMKVEGARALGAEVVAYHHQRDIWSMRRPNRRGPPATVLPTAPGAGTRPSTRCWRQATAGARSSVRWE
ncbi:pyridoxal-phosphate dependent enzyme [Kitasatospora sp. NPDC127111]|uniref:pyridoxal-phosphate dependent enzyme n=1 Tax=Kitasatospora sp. NPDC127111 TaxID=3345363 RepID=UPI00362FBE6D